MKNQSIKLGSQLRTYRSARGLTLEQLSQAAGVSIAMLSQIEQGKINPTVAIMLKISDALDVGVAELIDDSAPRNILRLIPANDEHYTFRKDNLCEIRTLSPLNLEKNIEFYRLLLEVKGELNSESHFLGTEEFLYAAKGRFAVTSGGESASLSRGDSIHYRADIPHSIQNVGKGQAEAFLIVRYPGNQP
jgi:transcriptional regulator with XRE-family HTH domain